MVDFDKVIERRNTGSFKWDKYKGTDILPMWIADMDFTCADGIKKALCEHVDYGVFGYAVAKDELIEVTQKWLMQRHSFQIDPSWLIWLPGLVPALNIVCRTMAQDGDEVITFVPTYPPFISAPKLSDRTLLTSPLKNKNGRYVFDLEDFKNKITKRTRVLILCSPHNPTGRVWDKSEVEQIAQICLENNITICSDEIHCDLVLDDKKHIPTATLSPEIADNTITLMAASKTFNVPGLSCAFVIISNPHLRMQFLRGAEGILPDVNALGYTATLAAFRDCENWRQQALAYLRQNRDIVYDFINNQVTGLSTGHVEATYLAWIDARELGLNDPADFFAQAGVGLSDGKDFGGQGFLRLNFACPRSTLMKGLERIKKAVDELKQA